MSFHIGRQVEYTSGRGNYPGGNRRYSGGGGGGGGGGRGGAGRGGRPSFGRRHSGGNVEHRENALPQPVQLAKQILMKLGDFSTMTADEDIVANIEALSNIMVSGEDLTVFASDISDLFVKSFTQLSVQTPILATLLALIDRSSASPAFPELVLQKLTARLLVALEDDEVPVAKLALRALGCLASSRSLRLVGPGSLTRVLDSLLVVVEGAWAMSVGSQQQTHLSGAAVLSHEGQIAAYLVATILPWIIGALVETQHSPQSSSSGSFSSSSESAAEAKAFVVRARNMCERVCREWRSPFEVGGQQALFHVPLVHATDGDEAGGGEEGGGAVAGVTPRGPRGAACWDALWEACRVAADLAAQAQAGAEAAANSGESYSYGYPTVMTTPWRSLGHLLGDAIVEAGTAEADDSAMATSDGSNSSSSSSSSSSGRPTTAAWRLTLPDSFFSDLSALSRGGKMGTRARGCCPPASSSDPAATGTLYGQAIGSGTAAWLGPRFPVFDAETSPGCAATCGRMSQLEKFVAMDYCRDILRFFDPYIRDDGTRVGSLDLMVAHLLAVAKMLAPLPLTSSSSSSSTSSGAGGDEEVAATSEEGPRLEYLLLETIFQLLLQLPTNSIANAQLFRVVLEVTKKNPGFAPAVALGTGILYNVLPEMDTSAARELARWLGYHLANTKLAWPYWTHWAADCEAADEDGGNAARMFCASVVDHCARNALPARVRPAVPDTMHALMPADPTPCCPLFSGSDAGDGNGASSMAVDASSNGMADGESSGEGGLRSIAAQLKAMVSRREQSDAIEDWLEGLASPERMEARLSPRSWKAQLLLQAVLVVAHVEPSSAVSSLASLVERYVSPLRNLAAEEGEGDDEGTFEGRGLMQTLMACLGHEPGTLHLALDVLLRRGVISPAAASEQLTTPAALQGLMHSHWPHALVEVTTDRAIDIVRAAIAMRGRLGAHPTELGNASERAAPRDMSNQYSVVVPSKQGAEGTEDAAGNGSSSGGSSGSSSRRRGDDGDDDEDESPRRREADDDKEEEKAKNVTATGAKMDTANDDEDDPVAQASAAVTSALRNARAVYAAAVGRLMTALVRRKDQLQNRRRKDAGADDEEGEAADEWTVCAHSLLLSVLRRFHGAEAGFLVTASASADAAPASLSDVSAVERMLAGEGALDERDALILLWRSFAGAGTR